jgi:acetoin utilization deacetylase AcuC-like enzyme
MKVFYNEAYTAAAHAFDTTRKSGEIATAMAEGSVPGCEVADPIDFVDLAEKLIEETHASAYVEAIRTGEPHELAESQGFNWDEGIWVMAVNSTAGVLAAVDEALATGGSSGSLSSGLHHARRAGGAGYCTVNGLAMAATRATELISGTVVILDLDAHCGGGTNELIGGDGRILHLDLSTSSFDSYSPDGDDELTVLHGPTDVEYLEHVHSFLALIPDDTGLVIYNAGMDPHPTVSAEGLAQRERLVAAWCARHGVPAAFVLAGGYTWGVTMDELVDLHLNTVRAFAGREPSARGDLSSATRQPTHTTKQDYLDGSDHNNQDPGQQIAVQPSELREIR